MFLLVSLILPVLACICQTGSPAWVPDTTGGIPGKSGALSSGRVHTNLTIGSSFSSWSGYGSMLTTYVSPSFSYRVSPKITLRAGITISNNALFGYRPWYGAESLNTYDANFSKALVYLEGTYLVTNRLTISGLAYKEFTIDDNSRFTNPFTRNNPQGIYMNADYRISDGFHFQAGFGYSKGYSPFPVSTGFAPAGFPGSSFDRYPLTW
jgi:hypothetical protein